jgi:hypothetical protein
MRIFLTGVGCVGKTTIGINLAELLDVNFFDLDDEIEMFFNTSGYLEKLNFAPASVSRGQVIFLTKGVAGISCYQMSYCRTH